MLIMFAESRKRRLKLSRHPANAGLRLRKGPAAHSPDMRLFRAAITGAVLLAVGALSRADPSPAIHYAPAENLERIDDELIDSAKHEIDFAAYVLTDWPVLQALIRAADRGVKVRIYLGGSQLAEREPTKLFQDLSQTPGVEIRVKRSRGAPMHLKLPNRWPRAANRRREFLCVRTEASGQ
jgi:phosphatidylserine/phosphatidylglycerophosphate/cardiolipin synthase-like enzyme